MDQPEHGTRRPEKKAERFCISTHQLLHLEDQYRLEKYNNDGIYGAACEIVKALEGQGIVASVVPGGLDFAVTPENVPVVAGVLREFSIDASALGPRTFHEDLVISGGLEQLAAKDPLGHGARVLGIISGAKN
jgi:hypothetical protein